MAIGKLRGTKNKEVNKALRLISIKLNIDLLSGPLSESRVSDPHNRFFDRADMK